MPGPGKKGNSVLRIDLIITLFMVTFGVLWIYLYIFQGGNTTGSKNTVANLQKQAAQPFTIPVSPVETIVPISTRATTPTFTPIPTATPVPATPTLTPLPSATTSPSLGSKYKVTFTRLNVINATEPGNDAGEVWLSFSVNGQTKRWPESTQYMQLQTGQNSPVNVEFIVILNASEKLNIFVNGTEVDVAFDDPMGQISKIYDSNSKFGLGTHFNERSTCDKGCFSLDYIIERI
jgi:hypothetical protein